LPSFDFGSLIKVKAKFFRIDIVQPGKIEESHEMCQVKINLTQRRQTQEE